MYPCIYYNVDLCVCVDAMMILHTNTFLLPLPVAPLWIIVYILIAAAAAAAGAAAAAAAAGGVAAGVVAAGAAAGAAAAGGVAAAAGAAVFHLIKCCKYPFISVVPL